MLCNILEFPFEPSLAANNPIVTAFNLLTTFIQEGQNHRAESCSGSKTKSLGEHFKKSDNILILITQLPTIMNFLPFSTFIGRNKHSMAASTLPLINSSVLLSITWGPLLCSCCHLVAHQEDCHIQLCALQCRQSQ